MDQPLYGQTFFFSSFHLFIYVIKMLRAVSCTTGFSAWYYHRLLSCIPRYLVFPAILYSLYSPPSCSPCIPRHLVLLVFPAILYSLYSPPSCIPCILRHLVFLVFPAILYSLYSRHLVFPDTFYSPLLFILRYLSIIAILYSLPSLQLPFIPRHILTSVILYSLLPSIPAILYSPPSFY